jgi:hypothetical protein
MTAATDVGAHSSSCRCAFLRSLSSLMQCMFADLACASSWNALPHGAFIHHISFPSPGRAQVSPPRGPSSFFSHLFCQSPAGHQVDHVGPLLAGQVRKGRFVGWLHRASQLAVAQLAVTGGFIGKGTRRAGALRVRERQGSAPIADRRVLAIPGRSLRHRPNAYGKLPYVGLVSPNPCVQETNFLCTVPRGASNWLPKRERMKARNLSGGAARP